jgi:hypothetical protein
MNDQLLPKAKRREIVVQELPDELMIYDLETDRGFCLNQTARVIFEQCDGESTCRESIEVISGKLGVKIDESILWSTIQKFHQAGLLEPDTTLNSVPRILRRDLIKSAASLTIAMPLIASIVAPAAVNAQSIVCVPPGGNCLVDIITNTNNCCPGATCTVNVGGVCCLILTATCDVNNDFCCPFTQCDIDTNKCVVPV